MNAGPGHVKGPLFCEPGGCERRTRTGGRLAVLPEILVFAAVFQELPGGGFSAAECTGLAAEINPFKTLAVVLARFRAESRKQAVRTGAAPEPLCADAGCPMRNSDAGSRSFQRADLISSVRG